MVDLNVVLWKVATFQYDPYGTGTPPFHGSHDKIRVVRTHDFPIGVMKRGMGRMQDELIAAACLLDRVFDYSQLVAGFSMGLNLSASLVGTG